MIVKASEMKTYERVALRGGAGSVLGTVVAEKDQMIHARLFDIMTIRKGCSIGEHEHVGEVEYYYILQGEGIVTEKDGEKLCQKGDVVITGWGASHAIRNEKDEDLVFVAVISTEA